MRCFSVFLVLAIASLGLADTLYMKDGRMVSGAYLGGTARQVRMDVGDRVETYDVSDVVRIEFQSATAAAPPPPPRDLRRTEVDQDRTRLTRPDPYPARQAPPQESRDVIPAGTAIQIRMIDGVDSETSQVGQTFQASLDDPIVGPDGTTLVERGADVVAKLVEDKQSGKVSGRTELTMDLVSIRVRGRMVDLDTQEVTTSSESRTGKSTKVIGGATALGAILGGIFGGGKGAAIGAVSGAGAGGAVQVLTKGQRVKIPAETRLSFTLQNAVRI